MSRPVYLDYAATTPVAPSAIEAMSGHLGIEGDFGNPASQSHIWGHRAREAVEHARLQIAELINATPNGIIWTSGATEANNLAIKGSVEAYGKKAHIITSQIEHAAVLDSMRYLESLGHEVSYIAPDKDGLITPNKVFEAVRDDTALVSLMHVNNELGTITDIEKIGHFTHSRGILFHVDAAQSIGRLRVDVRAAKIDLLSLSGHKIYAPKGIGALFVCRHPRARIVPQIHGGGHEGGLRPGTLPTHQIVGLGEAARLLKESLADDRKHAEKLTQQALGFVKKWPNAYVNGSPKHRVAGMLNVTIEGVTSAGLMVRVPHIAFSSGSACTSASVEPSHVLSALGFDEERSDCTIRLSIGRFTTASDIETAMTDIGNEIKGLLAICGISVERGRVA